MNIASVAKKLGFSEKDLFRYGEEIAKILLPDEPVKKKRAKLVLVTAITPTKAGEGKTTTSIGLTDGLNALLNQKKKVATCCLRQPSMGPLFGMKGGATGGGKASVLPEERINIHFTGDIHALSSAALLIGASIDNSIYQGNPLRIDPDRVVFPRAVDVNDRALRTIGVRDKEGREHEEHAVITAASELMTILCLAKGREDFLQRLKRITVAYDCDGKPVLLEKLQISNALWLILKDAFYPNLVRTVYGSPAIVHGGPFANIAHGCCSYRALKVGLERADVCVTEAGFGADLGGEKFMDILCQADGLSPDAVVLVASLRALKLQGGASYADLTKEDVEALHKGLANLRRHLANMSLFKVPVVVALNRFSGDSRREERYFLEAMGELNAPVAILSSYSDGKRGGVALAKLVLDTLEKKSGRFQPLYSPREEAKDKIEAIAKRIYGAEEVRYEKEAEEKLEALKRRIEGAYVCIAKTPLSFTDDPKILGAPKGFPLHVRGVEFYSGANLLVVMTGDIWLMPGLPKVPAAVKMEKER